MQFVFKNTQKSFGDYKRIKKLLASYGLKKEEWHGDDEVNHINAKDIKKERFSKIKEKCKKKVGCNVDGARSTYLQSKNVNYCT